MKIIYMMQPAIALNGREKRYEWIHNEQSIALRMLGLGVALAGMTSGAAQTEKIKILFAGVGLGLELKLELEHEFGWEKDNDKVLFTIFFD